MIAVLHLVLTTAAGLGVWRIWRAIAIADRRAGAIVGIGLLIRAFAGQALFWISWLNLPMGRSLQIGDGLWFFALDGREYLAYADNILQQGPATVFSVDSTYPSHFFVQVLTLAIAAFGHVASVAILLNVFAFVTTCLVVVHLANPRGPLRTACLFALLALSFGPGGILWSLQPLKDTLLGMLTVSMVGACRLWQNACRARHWTAARREFAWGAAGIVALVYAIAGIRWYLAAIMLAACAVFFLLTTIAAPRRRAVAILAVALLSLATQSFRFGGDGAVAPWVQRQLDPRALFTGVRPLPAVRYIADRREGFETTPGATTIRSGPGWIKAVNVLWIEFFPSAASGSGVRLALQRFGTGLIALVLPVTISRLTGLLSIGGGRNLWTFVELDTIAFDVVLLFLLWYSCRDLLRTRRTTPLFVMVAVVLAFTTAILSYVVTNFGTLFRMRQMVYVLAVVMPLTLGREITDQSTPDPDRAS